MHNMETLTYCQIEDCFEGMNGKDPNDDVFKGNLDASCKLLDRAIKMKDADTQAKAAEQKDRELELKAEEIKLKKEELEEARRVKELEIKAARKKEVTDTIVQIAKIVVPPLITVAAGIIFINHERTDIVTSTAGKETWKHVFRWI